MKAYYEKGLLRKEYISDYCHGNWQRCLRYQKEEAGIFHPDNMLPDGTIDRNLPWSNYSTTESLPK